MRRTALAICVLADCSGAVLLAGCTAVGGPECRAHADCASGVCLPDGTCEERPDATSIDADPTAPDAGLDAGALDGPAADADPTSPDAGGPSCAPDHDGTITRAEVPLAAGLHATFRVAADVTVSTAGEPQPDGTRRWDLAAALTGDHGVLVETLPLAGTWFADDFPGATYATPLSDSSDLLGVFQVTDTALLLLGVVSPSDAYPYTNVAYDPPVVVLQFPLVEGASWTTEATVSGTASGVYSYYYEDYTSQVDAAGALDTPFGTFPVLRVRVLLERTVGMYVTRTRSFAFVSECFGTVATITSQENETAAEFTDAAEVRRLAP